MSALDECIEIADSVEGEEQFTGVALDARSELAQLRATVAEQARRIAWLTSDVGEDGLTAINRLIAACELGDIGQHYAPDLSIARDEILRQARQLAEARELISAVAYGSWSPDGVRPEYRAWLAANPAPAQQEDDKQ